MSATLEMRNIQYKKNKKFLEQVTSLTKYPCDWVVTIAFYSALHLVEYHLIKADQKNKVRRTYSDDSHKKRRKELQVDLKLGNEVADAYIALYNECQAARYDCLPIGHDKVKEALEYLTTIEKELSYR